MSAPTLSVTVNGGGASGAVHSPRVPGSPRHQQYMANVLDAGTCATELATISAEAVRRTPLTSCHAAFGSLSLGVLQVCATPAARRSWMSSSSTGWPWLSRRSWCVAVPLEPPWAGRAMALNGALPLAPFLLQVLSLLEDAKAGKPVTPPPPQRAALSPTTAASLMLGNTPMVRPLNTHTSSASATDDHVPRFTAAAAIAVERRRAQSWWCFRPTS